MIGWRKKIVRIANDKDKDYVESLLNLDWEIEKMSGDGCTFVLAQPINDNPPKDTSPKEPNRE